MKILLAGGGSGGHFYPLIAVAESIRDVVKERKLLQTKIYYMANSPYNAGLLFDNEIEFHKIHVGKVRRYFSLRNVLDFFLAFYGFVETFIKVFWIFPDVIFSKGSFQSLPVVVAGKILGIPIVIHESDSVPGRANLWAAKFAKKIGISFSEASSFFPAEKTAWTGNPIRQEVLHPTKEGGYEYFNLEQDVPTILVSCGSQGAEIVNNIILDALPKILEKYQIIHQTGKLNFENVKNTANIVLESSANKERYHILDYLDPVKLRLAAGVANLMIVRGGSTIFEIAAWGIPSIIIPITDSNGDHQRKNAFNYARSGGAVVIDESNLTPEILISEIENILNYPTKQEQMRKGALSFAKTDAAYKIAEAIIDIAISHEK